MRNEEKQRQYESYIEHVDPMAEAIGRREPYHLTYMREHGDMSILEASMGSADSCGENVRTNNWGIYAGAFWEFYNSGSRTGRLEYADAGEALRANRAMLNRMSKKHIYDIRITRKGNVLYLEKTEVGNARKDN